MNDNIDPIGFFPDYTGCFNDLRLERRAKELWRKLSLHPSSTIRKLSKTTAEQKAYYRFLNNEKVEEEQLICEATVRMRQLAKGRHLLCIQDTSEINLSDNISRLKPSSGLGRSDKSDTSHCFKLHPGLVLDANNLSPLGFSHIKVFHRPEDMPGRKERDYKKQPIEDKESFKWIEIAQNSKEILKEAETVTYVEDREGDLYEQFALIPDEKHYLLIRSRCNRKLINGGNLYDEIAAAPISGSYTIEIPTDKRKKQYKREAKIELRFTRCSIKCPENIKNKGYPPSITVNCISVKETGKASNPVNWRLLTTHNIENHEQALLMVSFYSARWYIEQLFRILKHQGFGIEDTELESGWAIRKLIILQMTALLKIIQMNIAYSQVEGGLPIDDVFEPEQIEVLHLLNIKLQGKTVKLQNHNDPKRTKWATWVVARLGGWKGYDSQGPPGVIVLMRGLDRLNYIIEGTKLVKDVGTR